MYIYLRKNFFSNSFAQIFFIILSLSSLIALGTTLFKYIILIIFSLSIFYIEFKNFDKFVAIINSFAILILLFFTKLNIITIVFCFFLFYGFFKFKINLTGIKLLEYHNKKIVFLIFLTFLLSIFLNLKPQNENYFIYFSKDKVETISKGKFKYEILINRFNNHKTFKEICEKKSNRSYSKNGIILKEKCYDLSNLIFYNRISINNLDPNLFSLILFFIVIFFLKTIIPEKKIILFFVSFISFLIIEYLTKSRVLIVYYSLYIFFEYFIKNKHINFFRVFLSFNIALYLFAFLYNYQFIEYDISNYTNPFFRLIDLFDDSLKIRFSNISNSIIYQIQNLNEIILPGSIEHFNATQSINKFNNYSPHNLLLALIKDYGLIVALIMILNIKYLYDESSSNNFLSLLLSLGFLGYSILFIFIFILFEKVFNYRK
jgi:hypothetical protein